ncbi:HPF/RaiA family ribosome-associated protein [Myxococcota bacterium]|nr:HPF/RaiA family ribosome-associated protein [Myxococcota bacterium]
MRLEISFRNTPASDEEKEALKLRVERKIRKVTRFLRDPIEVGLVLQAQKVGYRGELLVAGAGEDGFKASIEAEDPIAAIDGLVHTVERAARRSHDRRLHTGRRGGRSQLDGFAAPGFELSEHEDRDLESAEIQKPGAAR